MYCKYCGKFIETEADVCPECLAQRSGEQQEMEEVFEQAPVKAVEEPIPAPQQSSSTAGLGKAITGAALGFTGFIFAIVGMELSILPIVGLIFNLIFALPMSIIALVFGIQSIKTFKKVCKEGGRKPIATLICGIAGVVLSGNALMFVLIGLIVSCSLCIMVGSGVK